MDSKNFIKIYNSLNSTHKHIAFQTLYMMDRAPNKTSPKTAVYQIIKKKLKESKFGYETLYKEIARRRKETGLITSKKTYDSVMRRKTTTGETFELICQTLQLQPEDINTIKFEAQIYDQGNIECLFNSLTKKNKTAITTLINLLHVEETYPQYFDDL